MKFKKSFLLLFLFNFFIYSNCSTDEISDLQAKIDALGYKWTAKESFLTYMSEEELQNFIGKLLDEEIPCANIPFWNGPPSNSTAISHPTTIPKNQKKCGSCWAFSSAGALETLLLERNFPESQADLSEQFVVDYCSLLCDDHDPTSCDCPDPGDCVLGGSICKQARFVKNCGLLPEWCRRYEAVCYRQCLQESCIDDEDLLDYKNFKLTEYYNVHQNIDAIKSALKEGPLVAVMLVYGDFKDYGSGVYQRVPDYDFRGAHAIEVIGYKDDNSGNYGGGYFICKNSWGTA